MGVQARPLAERIPGKWKYNPANGCWEWRGAPDISGYGRIWRDGRSEQAHRAAWLVFKGPLPEEACVLHRCDNRRCVNPDHLFIGDRGTNNTDRAAKKRSYIGPKSWSSKLDAAKVVAIRESLAAGETRRAIAMKFAVSPSAINDIALGKTWRHVMER